jgi:hypothetical protein
MKKLKNFACKHCKKSSICGFNNNVYVCSGLLKNPNPPHDHYRLCIKKNKELWKFNLMIEEAVAVIEVLSTSLMKQYVIEEKNGNKKRKTP